MKRIHVYLPEPQILYLEALATATGIPFSELLRRLLDEAIERRQRNGDDRSAND
jgi:predicted DNA binding CopG/RHH family protein